MKKYKIGLQIYTIKPHAVENMDKALKEVAEMGYDTVEFAGYYGHSAEEIKEMLDKYGLECPSVHQHINIFEEEGQAAVDFQKKLGVKYSLQNETVSGGEQRADIIVEKSYMQGITLTGEDVPALVDELPLIALLCAFADGESKITGAKELRVKESDRIKTTAELINNLGGDCQELEDGFIIRGKKKLQGGNINSYLDHRIAMTGAVGLLASERGGSVIQPECCAISFPDFFEKLGV